MNNQYLLLAICVSIILFILVLWKCISLNIKNKQLKIKHNLALIQSYINNQHLDKAHDLIQLIALEIKNNRYKQYHDKYNTLSNQLSELVHDKKDIQVYIQKLNTAIQEGAIDDIELQIQIIDSIRKRTHYNCDWTKYEELQSKANKIKHTALAYLEQNVNLIKNKIDKREVRQLHQTIDELAQKHTNQLFAIFLVELKILKEQLTIIEIEEQNKATKQSLDRFDECVKNNDVEGAKELSGLIKICIINPVISASLKQECTTKIELFETKYKSGGIAISTANLCVNYDIPTEFTQNDKWQYSVVKFPARNSIIFPYRRKQIARRGYTEADFELALKKHLPKDIKVLGDVNLLPTNNQRPFEPDIAIVSKINGINIFIDIEIDEPYGGMDRKPIHYIGNGDEFRDAILNNLGWIVVRFSEKQINTESINCVAFIARILKSINTEIDIPTSLLTIKNPTPHDRWTDIEAKILASKNYRENYLNHIFGLSPTEDLELRDITQTTEESDTAINTPPLIISPKTKEVSPINLDDSNVIFPQDSDIGFEPNEHVYLYKGKDEYTPVSSIVANFFTPFKEMYWSKHKADERGITQGEMLEEWYCKGAQSREVGTFMHEQIERIFNKQPIISTYNFTYKGEYFEKEEEVSISDEILQFKKLAEDYITTPFRTEWRIYDVEHKIAGTIDFICKNENTYDIYDWKRSEKIVDSFTKRPNLRGYNNQSGINGLESVQDTKYLRYCLQQNLYRYILEKNYNIKIGKMYLVVLHSNYGDYILLEVPYMDKEISIILKNKGSIDS